MRIAFSPGYRYEQAAHPIFPVGKNLALYDQLRREGLVTPETTIEPERASWDLIAQAHDASLVAKLQTVRFTAAETRRYGFPLTPGIVDRARFTVQGTLEAAREALRSGFAGNLAGGSHHSRPGAAAGYCLLNDVAVAAIALLEERAVERILVVDLDVHQGDGTALFFAEDERVFTFSMHAERNFPSRKVASDRDVALPDGTEDEAYLGRLAEEVDALIDRQRPELIFYNAGVDVVSGDRLGRLALTTDGLRSRDRWVLTAAARRGIPVAAVLGGGYRTTAEETAELHAVIFREADQVFRGPIG